MSDVYIGQTLPKINYYYCIIAAYKLELALAISFVSFGSSQILFLPHFITAAASRFCNRMVLRTNTSTQNSNTAAFNHIADTPNNN